MSVGKSLECHHQISARIFFPLFQPPAITDPSGSGTSLFRGSITKRTNWQSLEGNQAKNVPGFATFKMVSYSIQLAN